MKHDSTWDKFGTRLRDMPFLRNFFENPYFGKLFGETEIGKCLREMKRIDPAFRLAEFHDTIEHVVAPKLVQAFLEGDDDLMKLQCGDAAYATVHGVFQERVKQKVDLDTSILLPPRAVELKGARSKGEEEAPCFVWTFKTQQINCLRDKKGNVVEGAIDDIREVFYAIAVVKHPEPDRQGLEFPWQVEELAIVGSNSVW